MTTLCDLAARLPIVIGGLLDREAKLKRGRFREETLTDILTGALAAFAGPDLVIAYPPEKLTGGDLDLQFWNVKENRNLWIRIQAKRLNAAGVKIKNRSYNELLHKPSAKLDYQFRTIQASPAPWIPLYMFYNHAHVVSDPAFTGAGPLVRGVNLAFANDIASEMEKKLSGAPTSGLFNKRLSHLRQHFFGLEAIFCPGHHPSIGIVPSPDSVSRSLRRQLGGRSGVRSSESERELYRRLAEPAEFSGALDVFPNILDGPSVRVVEWLERPLITFISGRTE